MLNDIIPPRRPIRPPSLRPMRSRRLRGHSADTARARLAIGKRDWPKQAEQPQRTEEQAGALATLDAKRGPHFFWRLSKKKKILLTGCTIMAFGTILSVFFIFFPHKEATPVQNSSVKVEAEPPKPTTTASPLSGMQVPIELAKRPVTAVMIENSLDARPQSGLHEAGVVFEAIAEGGITRFMALFQDTQPQYVGPVRSLRPYYLDFSTPFQASVAHVGGSPEALAQIRSGGYRDIDQFFNAGAYWRSSNRVAPHNMYTSFQRLDELNRAKGYATSEFTVWPRKEDRKLEVPTAARVDVNISSHLYNSHYDYDPASNSYLRSEGGRPHISTSSSEDGAGQQLRPKVVIVLAVPFSRNGIYSVYGLNGSGTVFVFQDGGVTQGTWTKADRSSQFVFTDATGQPLALNAGQAWVTLVARPNMVTYAP